jgi:hypothetical protein
MNRAGLWFLLIGGLGFGLFAGAMYISFDATDRLFDTGGYEEKIRQNGIEAEARIISIDDALMFGGISMDEMKYLEIKMEIDNGNDEPYVIAIDTTVPNKIIFDEGDIWPVRIDPENERGVVYDFERGDLDLK